MPNAHHLADVPQIAIIGMACRFPGAKGVDQFWRNISRGVESITFFSDDQLRALGIEADAIQNPNYVRANAILEDVDLFDAAFFGFTPREAEIIDPQHRLFLECAWELLEAAGYDPDKYTGSIAVYAGASANSYLVHNLLSNGELLESVGPLALSVGSSIDSLTTRVAYKLNLTGAAVAVQSACSTSLVALHLACQNLLTGECDMAMAGGSSIIFPQKGGYWFQEGGIFSSDGHCRPFDAKATGTVGSRGVGIVLVKRLEDAIADGDQVHAMIRGSAINNDGSLKIGFTAPSIEGQSKVIAEALAVAGVHPETVGYVETHGTATTLGDPIEIAALTQAFRASTLATGFCAIGSVKSNIGHADTAAGVAGVIKTVMALKHRKLPPSLHYERPNPEIDFESSPFFVNTALTDWNAHHGPRRAGVSSFGIGGTNAHVVLEEAPPLPASGPSRSWQLLLVSAKTKAALDAATRDLADHFRNHPDVNVADAAYTLRVGRRDFAHRRMLVCRDLQGAVSELERSDATAASHSKHEGSDRHVAFMFPGQGAQYVNMAKDLYDAEPVFRATVDQCCDRLKSTCGLDLRELLFPQRELVTAAADRLTQTEVTQPALFVIEYGLARLWMSWGVRPQCMIGHSVGEYVAACLAGVFPPEEALTLVSVRGALMQRQPTGSMLAVFHPHSELRPFLRGRLCMAAVNAPSLCVVSGPTEEVRELESQLRRQEIDWRRLHTSHAFHSAMMDGMLDAFEAEVRKVRLSAPIIPFISNLTATWITPEQATDPIYWVRHLRHTVRFSEGVSELLREPSRILLEVGPGQALGALAGMSVPETQRAQKDSGPVIVSSMRQAGDSGSDVAVLLHALGRLWLAGVRIDWSGFYANERRHRLALPTYPFQRQRYWIEPQDAAATRPVRRRSGKRPNIADWFYAPSWKRSSRPARIPGLETRTACWLILADSAGVHEPVVRRLRELNQEVVVARIGKRLTEVGERLFEMDPLDKEQYTRLFRTLRSQGRLPDRIVHFWAVTRGDDPPAPLGPSSFQHRSLLFLAQALGEEGGAKQLHLSVVSDAMQDVLSSDRPSPEKALLLGPCRVIPEEYPDVTCSSIDIALSDTDGLPLDAADALVAEVVADDPDVVVAHRAGHRWVQTFEPVHLDTVVVPSRLRPRGVYLITGGLGGIGLALAEYLAVKAQAKLVLLGRRALPPRVDWPRWLADHDAADKTGAKIRKLVELEGAGAEILVATADVANMEDMRRVVAQASQRFGCIHGVIHSAGIAAGSMIQLHTQDKAEAVLAAKVDGTRVLDELFRDTPLDFMIFCSSLASILGGVGQVDYCAANAYLDAFANRRKSRGLGFTVSIDWDTWSEVGMAVDTEVPPELKAGREDAIRNGISSREGMEVFERILTSPLPQILVSTRDLYARIDESVSRVESPPAADVSQPSVEPGISSHIRPELSSGLVAPGSEVEKGVAEIWCRLFGIDQVGIDDDFFELGGHSLLATQLLNRVRRRYPKAQLSLRGFFAAPNVRKLAQSIEESYGRSVEARAKSIRDGVLEMPVKDRARVVEDYLRGRIAQALGMEVRRLPIDGDLTGLDVASFTSDLISSCREDFDFRLYPHEILGKRSIQELADFILVELERITAPHNLNLSPPESVLAGGDGATVQGGARAASSRSRKNTSAVFLLSAPRSGSTLLRLMLAGHSHLFCPPELGLLAYDTLDEVQRSQTKHPIHSAQPLSVVRVFTELRGVSRDESQALASELLKRGTTVQEVYREIQELLGDRLLVDKTPSYAATLETLLRAEDMFDRPKFIHLVRHPYPMIDSSARYRLQVYFDQPNVDPYLFAESIWATWNRNILDLSKVVNDGRYCLLRYEDLVSEPRKRMTQLCGFLNIPFENALLFPYGRGRMIDGPGDLDILRHDGIDSALGNVWKTLQRQRKLSPAAATLAAQFAYELGDEPQDAIGATGNAGDPRQLLANLDNLSNDEMDSLLGGLLGNS